MKTSIFKTKTIVLALFAITFVFSCSKEGEPGPEGPQGEQGIQGIQGEQGPAGADGEDGTNGTDGTSPTSIYMEGDINAISTDVTTQWVAIGEPYHIGKSYEETTIEVYINTHILSGSFQPTNAAITFQIRVDGVPGDFGSFATIQNSDSNEFISLYAVFENLSGGSHHISIFAKMNTGTSTSVTINPGNFGSKIIAKES